jgi:hypothetical protein
MGICIWFMIMFIELRSSFLFHIVIQSSSTLFRMVSATEMTNRNVFTLLDELVLININRTLSFSIRNDFNAFADIYFLNESFIVKKYITRKFLNRRRSYLRYFSHILNLSQKVEEN